MPCVAAPSHYAQLVDEKQAEVDGAETNFKEELEKLQKHYEELVKEKEAAVAAASPDLRTMRTVLGSLTKVQLLVILSWILCHTVVW